MKIKKIVYISAFLSLSLIFSYIEFLIPLPVSIPGIKLGLANGVILIALNLFGPGYAFLCGFLRVVLSFLLFGNMYSFAFSLCGFLLSFLIMIIIKKLGVFTNFGVSVSGAVFHNIGQIVIASLITHVNRLWTYLFFLTIAAVVTGCVNAYLANIIIERIKKYDSVLEGNS